MNSKRKSAKSPEKTGKAPILSHKDVRSQMQLLGFARSRDMFLELLTGMQSVDQELKSAYDYLHTCNAGSMEEEDCLLHIRHLENQRFQLLSELHGNRVNDYHILSIDSGH